MKLKLKKNSFKKVRWQKKLKTYTADFETTTQEEDCRVWAYAICEVGKEENFYYGNNIEDFMKFCEKENCKMYFHNLKFDGEFIFYYLLTHGFKYISDKKYKEDKTFTCLISDMGQFFTIEVYFKVMNKKDKKVIFCDSLKILNFSVEQIAKSFKLEIRKLNIDYNEKREIGHALTKEEIEYIKNDVTIVAKALKVLFDENLKKMTQAGNSLFDYKNIITDKKFNHWFPILDYYKDKDIRQSYKGGFTYLNPIYKRKRSKKYKCFRC